MNNTLFNYEHRKGYNGMLQCICSSIVLVYIIDGPNNHAACVVRYFHDSENQETQDDSTEDLIYKGYKAVLDSRAKDETLVTMLFPSEVKECTK